MEFAIEAQITTKRTLVLLGNGGESDDSRRFEFVFQKVVVPAPKPVITPLLEDITGEQPQEKKIAPCFLVTKANSIFAL